MSFWSGKKRIRIQIDATGIVICLLASFVVYFTALKPLYKQRNLYASQHQKLLTQQDESLSLGLSMRTLDYRLVAIQKEFAENEIKLKSPDQTNQRIADLTTLSTECALGVDDIKTGKICNGPKCDLMPISIAGRGGYKECLVFLYQLNKNFADINVVKFELAGDPAMTERPGTFNFQLIWYTAPTDQIAQNQNWKIYVNSCSLGHDKNIKTVFVQMEEIF